MIWDTSKKPRASSMLLEAQDVDFVQTKFPEVEGWCIDHAAYLTLCLLSCQARTGLSSSFLEIGVYKGKYLSVLFHEALRTSQLVVGIDTFQCSEQNEVLQTFTRLLGSTDGLRLVKANSRDYTPKSLLALLGGQRPSFVSVDGDHTAEAVLSDLNLVGRVLNKGGIVAIDDFLNPLAIGASEGVYRYFFANRGLSLRPFVYAGNKLFVTDRKYHGTYRSAIMKFISEMPELPMVQAFIHMQTRGQSYVEQQLLGSPVLIFC